MLEKNKVYNLSEFCRVLRESQQSKQEFKAKKVKMLIMRTRKTTERL